jgi:hypothetical protein
MEEKTAFSISDKLQKACQGLLEQCELIQSDLPDDERRSEGSSLISETEKFQRFIDDLKLLTSELINIRTSWPELYSALLMDVDNFPTDEEKQKTLVVYAISSAIKELLEYQLPKSVSTQLQQNLKEAQDDLIKEPKDSCCSIHCLRKVAFWSTIIIVPPPCVILSSAIGAFFGLCFSTIALLNAAENAESDSGSYSVDSEAIAFEVNTIYGVGMALGMLGGAYIGCCISVLTASACYYNGLCSEGPLEKPQLKNVLEYLKEKASSTYVLQVDTPESPGAS